MTGTPQIQKKQKILLALTPQDHVDLEQLCEIDGNRTKSSIIRAWIRERACILKESKRPTEGPKTTPTGD